jgi:hypothetical protein
MDGCFQHAPHFWLQRSVVSSKEKSQLRTCSNTFSYHILLLLSFINIRGDILIDSLGGNLLTTKENTAFPHYHALYHMQFNVFWTPGLPSSNQSRCEDWLKKVYDAVGEAGVSDAAYRNYPAQVSRLSGWQEKYFGSNYEQLQQVVQSAPSPHPHLCSHPLPPRALFSPPSPPLPPFSSL